MNKKKIFVLVQTLFFLFFFSQVFAINVSLTSNTNQCITDCKAVLHVSNLIAASALPNAPNANFRVNFVSSPTANALTKYDLNICYWESVPISVPFYKDVNVLVHDNNSGLDINVLQRVVDKYVSSTRQQYDCNNFFGSRLNSGQEYDIVLSAKRRARLLAADANDAIDWQITFAGITYSQFAWWNNNWTRKKQLEICANTDLNAGQLVWLKGIDFSTLLVESDLHDIRVIDENTNTELARLVEGTSTSTDGNLFFALDRNILSVAGINCDKNYYMYYSNPSATFPDNTASSIETFERYDLNKAIPFWVWSARLGNPLSQVQQVPIGVKNGLQSLYINPNQDANPYIDFDWNSSIVDANHGLRNIDYNFWFFPLQANKLVSFELYTRGDGGAFADLAYFGFQNDGTISGNTACSKKYEVGHWYKGVFDWNWGKNDGAVTIMQGTDTNFLCIFNPQTYGNTTMPSGLEINAPDANGFVDDIQFFSAYQTDVFFVGNEISQFLPDVNFLAFRKIDSNSYIAGNKQYIVDWNITEADNNAVGHLFDLNYNSTRAQGGTSIFKDFNVAKNPLWCDSNDFLGALGQGTTCHYVWTLPTIFDGNAWLVLKTTSQTDKNFVFSQTSFFIDNNAPIEYCKDCNNSWQTSDTNIHLNCTDSSGNIDFNFSLDTNADDVNVQNTDYNLFALSFIDANVLWQLDGNWRTQVICKDRAGNQDFNWHDTAIDKTLPFLVSTTPDTNTSTSSTTPTLSCIFDDNRSGLSANCGVILYKNNIPIAHLTIPFIAHSCSYTTTALATGDSVFLDCNASDNVGNYSSGNGLVGTSYFRTAAFTINTGGGGGAGGGGGGGGGNPPTPLEIVVPSLINIYAQTNVLELPKGVIRQWRITIVSLSDSDLPILLELPETLKPFVSSQNFCENALLCKPTNTTEILKAKQTSFFDYYFTIPKDMNSFTDFTSDIVFNLNNGQNKDNKISLTLKYVSSQSFLDVQLFGVPFWVWLVLVFFAVIIFFGTSSGKKNG